jgi:hypothetical protein
VRSPGGRGELPLAASSPASPGGATSPGRAPLRAAVNAQVSSPEERRRAWLPHRGEPALAMAVGSFFFFFLKQNLKLFFYIFYKSLFINVSLIFFRNSFQTFFQNISSFFHVSFLKNFFCSNKFLFRYFF